MKSYLEFWQAIEKLVHDHRLVIDRPRGSVHPHLADYIYPLDYGYLEGCRTSDGAGVDVWRGSLPIPEVSALFISVDEGKGDVELKIALGTSEPENQLIYDSMAQIGLHVLRLSPLMNAQEWLTSRRSVRHFQERKIAHHTIERILELSRWAPSAHNTQPWRFVVLENESSRRKLADALGESFRQDLLQEGIPSAEVEKRVERSRRRIIQAPAAILLCLAEEDIPPTTSTIQQAGEQMMAVQSVALAGGQLMLAAHTLGVASVWLCAPLYAPQIAQRVLDLAATWQPQALILLGYAAQTPEAPPRKPLEDVALFL
ncbi:MAG: nitroreductase family protein [Anaerolineales bacterium]